MSHSGKSGLIGFSLEEDGDRMVDANSTNDDVEFIPQSEHDRHHNSQLQEAHRNHNTGPDTEATKVRRKRAETWVHDETRSLITFRKELDEFFNTSKSNKHLWEMLAAKMSEKGYRRTAAMCTDKWRNMLKDYKKSKQHEGGAGKLHYEELEEFFLEKKRNDPHRRIASSRGSTTQSSEQGVSNAGSALGVPRDGGRARFNPEMAMDFDQQGDGIVEAEAVAANGLTPWNRREPPGSGSTNESTPLGKVIWVSYGKHTKLIGIDGSSDSIKEAIRSAFGLRTNRAFWLEDENKIVRSLDRDMPLRNYTLHLDAGLTIKICVYNELYQPPQLHTEEKTFYCLDDLCNFLHHRGWMGLRDLSCYKVVEKLEDLQPGEMYQGLRSAG